MNQRFPLAPTLAACVLALGAGPACAQFAGQALVKVGWNRITPQVKSGDLSPPALPNTQIDIQAASAPIISAAYMFTDNVSWELIAGLPYKHRIVGAGAVAGVGEIATVHQISPTFLFQYRFMRAEAPFRPYVGVGPTYAVFYSSQGSAALTSISNSGGQAVTIGSDRSWGVSGEVGATYKLNRSWFLDAAVLKTYIGTRAPLSTGQSISARLNPVSANVSVGFRF